MFPDVDVRLEAVEFTAEVLVVVATAVPTRLALRTRALDLAGIRE
ncbi:hypothetical protein ACFXCR_03825 [Streptomyces sp. NPDC059431]